MTHPHSEQCKYTGIYIVETHGQSHMYCRRKSMPDQSNMYVYWPRANSFNFSRFLEKVNLSFFWGPCYKSMPLLHMHKQECWDFLQESVKEPIRIEHDLFMRTKKAQWVGPQLVTCARLAVGFRRWSQILAKITLVIFETIFLGGIREFVFT